MEERVYRVVNERLETTTRRLSTSSQTSFLKERQRVIESTSSLMGGNTGNMKKMESALNEWLQKVEEQVNQFDNEKASLFDLQQLDAKLQNEVRDRQYATDQILQIA